jgi:hypothetical protein
MNMMPICTLGAVVLLGVTTFAHGTLTERWSTTDPTHTRAALAKLPATIAGWTSVDLDSSSSIDGETVGALVRKYTNPATGKTVTIALTHGPASVVSVHTPDICFPASGFAVQGEVGKTSAEFGGATAQFYSARFLKQTQSDLERIQVLWAWTPDGTWQAPTDPRHAFAGQRKLYKLYLVSSVSETDDPTATNNVVFAPEFLQAVRTTFFAQ